MLTIGGCTKAPKGQTVAILNGDEITSQQISAEMEGIIVPANAVIDPQRLRREILQGLIDRKLEVARAREMGLDKTPEFLALRKRNEEELLASMLGHKFAQTVPLPLESEVRQYMDTHPYQFARRQKVTIDELTFVPPRDRRQLAVLANAHSLAEAEAALLSIGIVPRRAEGEIDTGFSRPEIAAALEKAPPGEPLLLPLVDRLVVGVVTAREPVPVSPDDAYLTAARALRAANLLHESQAEIAAARSTAQIKYEPGWAPAAAASSRR